MVSMVKYCMWAEKFLELSEASCKTGLVLEMSVVEAPLVCEERFQVLDERWW